MKTHQKAKALLNGRTSKELAGNTVARITSNGSVAVQFHQTDIVTVEPSGVVRVSNGGWMTTTTKGRINWILGLLGIRWSIFQKSGQWCWSKYLGNGRHSAPVPFADLLAFTAKGGRP